jgi:hypothetical protein
VKPEKAKYMLMSRSQNMGQKHSVKRATSSFENVPKFKHLGTRLTNQNCMHEGIKCRLISGNACYHSVQSSILSPDV